MRPALLLSLCLLPPAALAQNAPQQPAPVPSIEAIDFAEAVRRAAQHSTSAGIAQQEVFRVEGLLGQVRSASLPLVAISGTVTHLDEARIQPAQGTSPERLVTPQNQNSESVSLTLPIFAPSRWYQWSHASDQVDVARASQSDIRRLVSLAAARAYLTIIAQKRAIDVSRRAVETAAAHYDYAHTRRLGGVGNALDEARADQQLAAAQAQLQVALAGLTRAQEALGVAAGADGPLDARAEPDLSGGPSSLEEGSRNAEEERTDVLLARRRSEAAHRVTRDSWSDWLPTLSFNAQAFRQDPPTISTPEHGWQAQLFLSFPLYEGGLRMGQLRERKALEAESRIQLAGTLQQARAEVRIAYANLQHSLAALEQVRRGADSARSALSLVQQAFRAGATTSLDVTDAERTARDADAAAVIAEDAVRQSRLDFLAASGRFPAE